MNFLNDKNSERLIINITDIKKNEEPFYLYVKLSAKNEIKNITDIDKYTLQKSSEIRVNHLKGVKKIDRVKIINHIVGSIKDYYLWIKNS